MKSVIYPLRQLKRISNFDYPLDEIGIMLEHAPHVINKVLDRYFFTFSFSKEKYQSTSFDLRPSFSLLPPGTVLNSDGTQPHDELFFSYSTVLTEKIRHLFPGVENQKYRAFFSYDDEFNRKFMNLKELIAERNTAGVADKLDVLAIEMVMTAYINSLQSKALSDSISSDAKIQEIALKLKNGEKLEPLLRQYGYSRRAFYYDWGEMFSVSPKRIQLEAKLELAQKLLLTTELTIAEIAEQCKFSSHRYFHECFLKYFNSTPGDYRKRFQSK